MSKTKIEFAKQVYTAQYIMENPSSFAKGYRQIWRVAVEEWLRRNNFEFNRKTVKKPIVNVKFSQITRIYNSLLGVRNPPQPKQGVVGRKATKRK